MKDIDLVALQKHCETHPDYPEYERRQRAHIQSLADKEGMTHDEYIDRFNKWHAEHGIQHDINS